MKDLVTVLIADDEVSIRNGLEEIVSTSPSGAKVVAAVDNGKDAFLFIKQYQPDIAIIDINMPGYDGLEVIQKSVDLNYHTRFLILSGYNDFAYAQAAIRYGVKNYFLKPIHIGEFLKDLTMHCDEIRAARKKEDLLSPQRLDSLVQSSKIHFFTQLIQNRIYSAEDITHKLTELQLTLDNTQPCIVVVFRFTIADETLLTDLNEIRMEYIQTQYGEFPMESWVYDDTQILCVFHVNSSKDSNFRNLLTQNIHNIHSETGCKVKAGVGSCVSTLAQAPSSYLTAMEALSYHIYDENVYIYDEDVICHEKPAFSKENIDYRPIIYALTHKDAKGIQEYCSSFFQSLFSTRMPSPNFVTGMCMYLIMNVQKQIALLYPEQKEELPFHYEEVNSLESIHDIQNWVIDYFIRFGDILGNRKPKDNHIITAAKDYIQKNLHQNIKAKEVAAHVNLSEAYFLIYFKDKTGINFRDYLLTYRMNLAKTLLSSEDVTISEVADLVGYQDYRSFSRAFKNETGMSPSEYVSKAI